ncbi:MAG: hypothetical protein OES09_09210 [Gammaproteobacteria bacterium]|nr:hypothetical protein [Gammaproteobacteria bacterium]
MRITRTILHSIGGLALAVAIGGYSNVAVAGESFDDLLAQAEKEVTAAKKAGHEWKLLPNSGGKSMSLSKLLKSAKEAHAAGKTDDATKTLKRVIEAAKLGQQQAAEQANAGPNYN